MAARTRVSVEEYLAIPEDGPPWLEYIEGEVVEKPVGNADHFVVVGRLIGQLERYREALGGRTGAEGRARFDDPADARFMLPDVSFYRAGMRWRDGTMLVPPTLAVEVRSPGQGIDRHRERVRYYRAHGVEEAWLVDPVRGCIEVFDADNDGSVVEGGTLRSSSLADLEIDVVALFAASAGEFAWIRRRTGSRAGLAGC